MFWFGRIKMYYSELRLNQSVKRNGTVQKRHILQVTTLLENLRTSCARLQQVDH